MIHPYFPPNVLLSGGTFIENNTTVQNLILTFTACCTILLATTFGAIKVTRPVLKFSDQWKVLWFVLTGSIHVFFEGYFVYNNSRMPRMQDFFGQLWKEYALSDSRYMTSDPLVLW